MTADLPLRATVIYSPGPRVVAERALRLPLGATVGDALLSSGLSEEFPELATRALAVGVWGRKVSLGQALREGDRVEIYRALRVDPMVARRARFEAQGTRAAGLFSRRRPGAKAGY